MKKLICKLTGEDGNAFAIIGRVIKTMKESGVTSDEINKFTEEATVGDYDHLLATTIKYLNLYGIDWE